MAVCVEGSLMNPHTVVRMGLHLLDQLVLALWRPRFAEILLIHTAPELATDHTVAHESVQADSVLRGCQQVG